MKTHELKILPEYFEPVLSGEKTFEIRRNDRDFKVGDILLLKELKKDWTSGVYSGREIKKRVSYIYSWSITDTALPWPTANVQTYVVMSIKDLA